MNLAEVFVPLSINEDDSPLAQSLDAHYSWAFHHFENATRTNARWLTWLEESWKLLLPESNFPKHFAREFDTQLGYNTSPQRKSWQDVIFRAPYDAWMIDPLNTKELILDNDIRALTYDRLAQTLDAVVGKESGFFTRYVGGCLRSPLQLARAKYADACLTNSPSLEKWLLDEWITKYPAKDQKLDQAVRLPFWAGAIFARCKGNADALPVEIAKCRRQAAKLRKRRAELEEALRQSRIKNLSSLAHAVSGELDQLATGVSSGVGIAASALDGVLKTQVPGFPTEMIGAKKTADAMGSGWLKKLALRLFRPHVYFVYTLSQDAGQLGNLLKAAAQLFPLGGKDVSQPAAFLTRLRRTEWIV
jgi:hypothetical protein